MAPEATRSNLHRSSGTGAARWWYYPLCAVVGLFLFASLAALALALWLNIQTNQSAESLADEVARIRAADEPLTTDELYAFHRVPAGTPDITPLWQAALDSLDEKQLNADGKELPVIGDLDPAANASEINASIDALLAKYDATVQATLAAARQPGKCQFPVQFEHGFAAHLTQAQKMRALARLFLLRCQRQTELGNASGAVESLDVLFAASAALDRQLFLVEHLVRLAILGVGLNQTATLLTKLDLTDQQLADLQAKVQAADVQAGLTRALHGERANMYLTFHNIENLAKEGAAERIESWKPLAEGKLTRPADCLLSLTLFQIALTGSREPFPQARERALQIEYELKSRQASPFPLTKLKYNYTLHLFPAVRASFDVAARNIAQRDVLATAIAAERHRLKHGRYPEKLADLVPQFLSAVPSDPFDGEPLRCVAADDGLTIYSIGRDGKDNGGLSLENSGEPDISVHLPSQRPIPPPASLTPPDAASLLRMS